MHNVASQHGVHVKVVDVWHCLPFLCYLCCMGVPLIRKKEEPIIRNILNASFQDKLYVLQGRELGSSIAQRFFYHCEITGSLAAVQHKGSFITVRLHG